MEQPHEEEEIINCDNCGEVLIPDFIPMRVSLDDENDQHLSQDYPWMDLEKHRMREFEFDICAKCGASIVG